MFIWSGDKKTLRISDLHKIIFNWFSLLFLKKHTAQDGLDLIIFQTMKKTIPNDFKKFCEHTTPIRTRPNTQRSVFTNRTSESTVPLIKFYFCTRGKSLYKTK